jgi:hypothetical protein
MKPTSEQCRLAIEIGAALVHQSGRAATDLIRAGQASSPVLPSRLEHALSAAVDVPSEVAEKVKEFYALCHSDEETEDSRTESLRIRLSATEKSELQRQAADCEETVSAYIRRKLAL